MPQCQPLCFHVLKNSDSLVWKAETQRHSNCWFGPQILKSSTVSPTQRVSPTCRAGTQVFEISLPVSQAVCLSQAVSRELGRKQSSQASNGHPCGMPLLQVDTSLSTLHYQALWTTSHLSSGFLTSLPFVLLPIVLGWYFCHDTL